MPSRRFIPGVLHNFIGTFSSRYSDFDGYWLFGFLVMDLDTVRIKLLGEVSEKVDSPLGFARWLAVQRFGEQLTKAGVPREWVREAYLIMSKLPERASGFVDGQSSSGHTLGFQVNVVTDLGRRYDYAASKFVAPHNPKIELRSARAI